MEHTPTAAELRDDMRTINSALVKALEAIRACINDDMEIFEWHEGQLSKAMELGDDALVLAGRTPTPVKKQGFAALSPEKRSEIARKAGASPHSARGFSDVAVAAKAGRKGGKVSAGNFAKCPARAQEAGRKGGLVRAIRARTPATER